MSEVHLSQVKLLHSVQLEDKSAALKFADGALWLASAAFGYEDLTLKKESNDQKDPIFVAVKKIENYAVRFFLALAAIVTFPIALIGLITKACLQKQQTEAINKIVEKTFPQSKKDGSTTASASKDAQSTNKPDTQNQTLPSATSDKNKTRNPATDEKKGLTSKEKDKKEQDTSSSSKSPEQKEASASKEKEIILPEHLRTHTPEKDEKLSYQQARMKLVLRTEGDNLVFKSLDDAKKFYGTYFTGAENFIVEGQKTREQSQATSSARASDASKKAQEEKDKELARQLAAAEDAKKREAANALKTGTAGTVESQPAPIALTLSTALENAQKVLTDRTKYCLNSNFEVVTDFSQRATLEALEEQVNSLLITGKVSKTRLKAILGLIYPTAKKPERKEKEKDTKEQKQEMPTQTFSASSSRLDQIDQEDIERGQRLAEEAERLRKQAATLDPIQRLSPAPTQSQTSSAISSETVTVTLDDISSSTSYSPGFGLFDLPGSSPMRQEINALYKNVLEKPHTSPFRDEIMAFLEKQGSCEEIYRDYSEELMDQSRKGFGTVFRDKKAFIVELKKNPFAMLKSIAFAQNKLAAQERRIENQGFAQKQFEAGGSPSNDGFTTIKVELNYVMNKFYNWFGSNYDGFANKQKVSERVGKLNEILRIPGARMYLLADWRECFPFDSSDDQTIINGLYKEIRASESNPIRFDDPLLIFFKKMWISQSGF